MILVERNCMIIIFLYVIRTGLSKSWRYVDMKIGILVLSIGDFGKKGFYNLQEVGLAKALDSMCEEVVVYKLVHHDEEERKELIEGTRNSFIIYMPSKNIGTNGIPNMELVENR